MEAASLKNVQVKKATITVPGGAVKYSFREGKDAPNSYEMMLEKFWQNATTVLSSY